MTKKETKELIYKTAEKYAKKYDSTPYNESLCYKVAQNVVFYPEEKNDLEKLLQMFYEGMKNMDTEWINKNFDAVGFIWDRMGSNNKETRYEATRELLTDKFVDQIEKYHTPIGYWTSEAHALLGEKYQKAMFPDKEKENQIEIKVVKLSDIAAEIGNEPKEVTLPNGQTRMSINWDAPTAQEAAKYIMPLASSDKKIVFDGPAPAWFVSALTHSVHPAPVGLNDPKIGVVDIPQVQKGEPNPEYGIEFAVTEGKTIVRIDWQLTDPVYDATNLNKMVLPEIPAGKEVVIGGGTDILPNSGKGPNYIAVTIGEAYAHTNKAVSYYQPQTNGYTCGITHWPERNIGDVIPKAEIEKDLITSKDIGKMFFGGAEMNFEKTAPQRDSITIPETNLKESGDSRDIAKNIEDLSK